VTGTQSLVTRASIDRCRETVRDHAELYRLLTAEYERHELLIAPTRLYSPAGVGKAYLRDSGIPPLRSRQPDFPAEVVGFAMSAYYGGRAECRIRRVPVPVVTVDGASMHPTVCVLTGLWRFFTRQRVNVREEDGAKLQRQLMRLNLDDVFEPRFWTQLNAFLLVEPDDDVLPVRARYSRGASFGIGVNHLASSEPLWYPLADVVASTLLTGRTPQVLRLLRLRPVGQTAGLRKIRIRGGKAIDPARQDFFRELVEERRRLEQTGDPDALRTAAMLKVIGSSASYGTLAELNRQEPDGNRTLLDIYSLEHFRRRVRAVEQPGSDYFPPLAALVSGGARLMLALLERLVTDRGGSYAFCDTDAMAIVAAPQRTLIPCPGGEHRDEAGRACVLALSWQDVEHVRRRFATLTPYNRRLVPTLLELEDENLDPVTGERVQLYCLAISAKRYCLYTLNADGEPQLVKCSEHALGGFYRNPTNPDPTDHSWVEDAWNWLLRTELGLAVAKPDWFQQPALSQFTVSHPRLSKPFESFNRDKPYADQIKPANTLLVAHVAPGGHPPDDDPNRFALIAANDPTSPNTERLEWRNIYNPRHPGYRITTDTLLANGGNPLPPNTVGVKTYRDVVASYRQHPETKSLAPDGNPCRRQTIGLLGRRHIVAGSIAHIGKEANLLEEIAAGLVGADAETLTAYKVKALTETQAQLCGGCETPLSGRQRRWCGKCRTNRRRRSHVEGASRR
jgi:hypothetical protein